MTLKERKVCLFVSIYPKLLNRLIIKIKIAMFSTSISEYAKTTTKKTVKG